MKGPSDSWVRKQMFDDNIVEGGDEVNLIITLAIPELSPNRKMHWRKKSHLTRGHRASANVLTLAALNGNPPPCPVGYSLRYFWPSMSRDDDNAIASAKAYLDGMCDAMRVNDRHLRFRELFHCSDRKNPRLEIIMHCIE